MAASHPASTGSAYCVSSDGLDCWVAEAWGAGFDVAGEAAEVRRIRVGGDLDVVPTVAGGNGVRRGAGAEVELLGAAAVRVGDGDPARDVGGEGEVEVAGVRVLAGGDLEAGRGLALERAQEAVRAVHGQVVDAGGVDGVPAVRDALAGLGRVRPRTVGAVRGCDQELRAGPRARTERQRVFAPGNRPVDDRCVGQRPRT